MNIKEYEFSDFNVNHEKIDVLHDGVLRDLIFT